MRNPNPYRFNESGFGVGTLVNLTGAGGSYTLKPSDIFVLVDVTSGAQTIVWHGSPEDDWPVMIRNTAGSVATHNITVTPPTGWTIEDPANAGSFVSSLTMAAAGGFESGVWVPDQGVPTYRAR